MAWKEAELDKQTKVYVALTMMFVASLTASNFLASKIFAMGKVGSINLAAPAAVLAYALTFTFTDIISELYGRKAANLAVRIGFVTQLIVLGYALFALNLKAVAWSPADDQSFSKVIGMSGNIILASLTAYIVSQHHDVWAFHWWKVKTRGKWLWLRNNASTAVSQLIDTVIFISLAFSILPHFLGGGPLPLSLVGSIILGQYIVKLLIALADTPLVYAGVLLAKNYIGGLPTGLPTLTGTLKEKVKPA
ncbi:MAG: queuosine precursor transporter [Desulfurococcales archaeon]|nr:queuosine precursor transporter [Desulfurococcales archaeon]